MPPNPTDQKWSWVVALTCCFINCLLYGVTRLSGLLLVAIIETFHVSRARAAVPFSVCTSVRNLSGIIVGYFGQKFGLRPVVGAGCLLASFGAGLCFFASDIFWITVCWGVIFGMGCGLGTCLLPFAINQHFDKHRGKASGLSYSGSYVGSFLFPPIVVMLLENYGLNGAFLVISSTLLNGLAASLLFQPKSSNKLNKKDLKQQLESRLTSTEFESCTKNICQKLLHHAKWTEAFLKTKELAIAQEFPSIYLIAIAPLKDTDENQHVYTSPLESEFATKCLDTAKNGDSFCKEANAKSSRNLLQKRYAQNLHFQSRNVLFKGKLKNEYRLSIAKLRQTLLVKIIRKRYSFNSNLQKLPADDVKLLAFQNFNCILCSTLVDEIMHSKPHLKNVNNNDFFLKENLTEEAHKKSREDLAPLNQTSIKNYSHSVAESFSELQYKSASTNISVLKSKNSGESEINSSRRNNCSWKIYRQNQRRVSLVPAGVSSLSASELKSHKKYENPSESDVQSFIRRSWHNKFGKCCFGWFRLHAHPMFVVIATTMSLHTLVTVCMITIIEDFAKDLNVPDNKVHYALMALSTADLLGALTMGFITDHGLISRCYFIVLCFFGTGIFAIAISFSQNLTMLLTLVAFYGIFETGVIITFPLLIAQFIEVKKQAVALASSNALSSPTVLLVPIIIGYFRDRVGCYTGVFYVLGVLSFSSSLIWLVASYLFNKHKKQNQIDSHVVCC